MKDENPKILKGTLPNGTTFGYTISSVPASNAIIIRFQIVDAMDYHLAPEESDEPSLLDIDILPYLKHYIP